MFYFCKMQATGNDFVIVDCIKNKFEYSLEMLSKFLCDRHFGIGGDGVIYIEESDIADFKMRIFNSDGSEAEMCGNGIRCFAKYVFEKKLTNNEKIKIETLAGMKELELIIENRTVLFAKVDMGKPIFEYSEIPVIYSDITENGSIKIDIENNEYEVFPISMGNPHVVCFVENVEKIDVEKIGAIIEDYKYFPKKTNVEFVEVIDKENIKVRVWERGVGETLSCGTGACSASVMSIIKKSTESELTVDLRGGKLKIQYNKDKLILSGPASIAFEGTIDI